MLPSKVTTSFYSIGDRYTINNLGLFCIRTIARIARIGKSTISSPKTKGAYRCVRPAKPITL